MGFGFSFRRTTNQVKLIRKYVKERTKEKQILNNQLQRLDDQMRNKTIDSNTYERLRDVLEINFIKQREEALENAFPKHKKDK